MKKESLFKGISTAIVTPFTEAGEIDYDTFGRLIERQISGGCRALTVCGTTGEAATLSSEERYRLIKFATGEVGGRIPVIAGNGSNSLPRATELTHAACEAGCDALLTVNPYYNKGNEEGLLHFFTEIAREADRPIIIYNVPSRTGMNIPLSVLEELSWNERIIGIKDAGGSIADSMRLLSSLSDRLDIYCGNDDLLLPMLSLGCVGGISVLSNIIPKELQALCDFYFSGDIASARSIQYTYLSLAEALFCEANPIPVKYAMARLGLCCERLRLPLFSPSDANKGRIASALVSVGLLQ